MKNLTMVVLITLSLCAPAQPADKKAKKSPAPSITSITGCVDQRNGGYVLTEDTDMKPIMKLHWEGDQDSMFARHVGHRVTVEGAVSSSETGLVLNVKKVTEVSDSCMPAKEQ
jgi:hypothetical protein